MKVHQEGNGLIKAWTDHVEVEPLAMQQAMRAAQMPFIYRWLALMPDVHSGCGSTIGSVIPTKGAIIPAAVGVDIGCGMMAVRTTLTSHHMPTNCAGLRAMIEQAVPCGRSHDGGEGDVGAWKDIPARVKNAWSDQPAPGAMSLEEGYSCITGDNCKVAPRRHPLYHLGTLGTGNHFIELCLDEEDRVWVMLHSGSRGVGNRIGQTYIKAAKEDMRRYFINLPDQDLAYLPEGSRNFNLYCAAVAWAQRFAMKNRELMMAAVLDVLSNDVDIRLNHQGPLTLEMAVNCHHNYVAVEHHYGQKVFVTRKGAVRAMRGDLGIIPGSMGARSYIVEGLGNQESFHSCSHGAGRRMSRSQARRMFTVEEHAAATAGVECDKGSGTLDETPACYKDIDAVMRSQADLVKIKYTLKQFLCVKGLGAA